MVMSDAAGDARQKSTTKESQTKTQTSVSRSRGRNRSAIWSARNRERERARTSTASSRAAVTKTTAREFVVSAAILAVITEALGTYPTYAPHVPHRGGAVR